MSADPSAAPTRPGAGASAVRLDGPDKVTGRAIYAAEAPAPGQLHGVLVQAVVACGEVISVDGGECRRTPGFVDLVSYDEVRSLAPSAHTALIREPTVHFAGQPIALVVADTLLAAHAAARALRVEYRTEPAVATIDQGVDSGAAYEPAMAGRIAATSRRGDSAAALDQAAVVVRRRYDTAVNNHHPMELHAVLGWWEGDTVTVHTSTQAVFATRTVIAQAFGMPVDDVRVITKNLGGGFGSKGGLWFPWMLLALVAAKRANRPVRLELTRSQLFTLVGRRSETRQDLALGFDADGRLAAIEHHVLGQTSTFGEYSDTTVEISRILYRCANVTTSTRLVRTNAPQPIPMRAPGTAPGTFAFESAMDEAAERLGIDPVELRLRNFADHDQDAGRPWSSNGLRECYRIGAEHFGWAKRPPPGAAVDGHQRIGWGMATTFYPLRRQACTVRLLLAPDATLTVQCGTQDMGSGTYTLLGQLACEALDIPMSAVRVELGDTVLPTGPTSAGSQVTMSVIPAMTAATDDLRAHVGALDRRGGESLAATLQRLAPHGIEAHGSSAASSDEPYTAAGFGAVFAEVGVDADLGEIRVRRITAAFAAGRIINPLSARSQYVGGLIGGIGMALHERTVTDAASGRILGDNLADYLIPVHADMPDFGIALVEEHDPMIPGGAKGIGMLGTAGVQAAIANAAYHAVGRRIRHLPIRIEDLILPPVLSPAEG
jgi:xanthine dehydrogenase YagR molybdenum-binding subunit